MGALGYGFSLELAVNEKHLGKAIPLGCCIEARKAQPLFEKNWPPTVTCSTLHRRAHLLIFSMLGGRCNVLIVRHGKHAKQ